METFISTLFQRSPHLTLLGAAHFGASILFVGLSIVDHRMLLGVNVWLKPIKFALSIGIFAWTMAWLAGYLPESTAKSSIIWTIVITMLIEIICIVMQASRGVQSHFNISTAFNYFIFGIMGSAIAINTVAVGVALVLFFQDTTVPLTPAYLWSIRLGLLIVILASIEGFLMGSRLSHSVGAPDGTIGLPLLNWSRSVGDLRVMHFIGLHAIQVLPLTAVALDNILSERTSLIFLITISFFYGILCILALVQALAGLPVESLQIVPLSTP